MVYEGFAEMIKNGKVSDSTLDYQKMQSLLNEAEKLGIKKMKYEHPGHAAWKRRWDEIPTQFSSYFFDGLTIRH